MQCLYKAYAGGGLLTARKQCALDASASAMRSSLPAGSADRQQAMDQKAQQSCRQALQQHRLTSQYPPLPGTSSSPSMLMLLESASDMMDSSSGDSRSSSLDFCAICRLATGVELLGLPSFVQGGSPRAAQCSNLQSGTLKQPGSKIGTHSGGSRQHAAARALPRHCCTPCSVCSHYDRHSTRNGVQDVQALYGVHTMQCIFADAVKGEALRRLQWGKQHVLKQPSEKQANSASQVQA